MSDTSLHHVVVDSLVTELQTPRGFIRPVDDVSFVVDAGKSLGIVGESGSGKSVLLRSVIGSSKRLGAHHEGSVTVDGVRILDLSVRQLRKTVWGRSISIVFQDPLTSLNPVVKIGRQITETLHAGSDVSSADARLRAIDLLRSVGISGPASRMSQYPHELSGGMRQRVAIAIAIACGPGLLLADEPTTALDVTVQAHILELLSRRQEELQSAMILVTHDFGVVANRVDEIAVMYAGQIVERAPTRSLLATPRMPYTRALIDAIPRLDQPSHTRLRAITGRPPNLWSLPAGCRFAPRCTRAEDVCRRLVPPLTHVGDADHLFRCWFPIEVPTAISVTTRAGHLGVHATSAPTQDGH